MYCNLILSKKNKWFTLVELIVVITILAILGTIAFLSFQWYASSARDSVRVSDMDSIAKWLTLYNIKTGSCPTPASSIELMASGAHIGYQWYMSSQIFSNINFSANSGTDPLDGKNYTYTVNQNATKFEILGLLENSESIAYDIPGINTAYAASYIQRIPMTKWDSLAIFLGSTGVTLNQPIQEQYNAGSFTGIDVLQDARANTLTYIDKNTSLIWSGPIWWELFGRFDSASSTYPGCDTPDLRLPNGQIWAACNVWASRSVFDMSLTNVVEGDTVLDATEISRVGYYFQWGRNDSVTNSTTTGTLAPAWTKSNTVGHMNFIYNTTWVGSGWWDWMSTHDDNLWGGLNTDYSTGTYWSTNTIAQIIMQWPCEKWYHIPTLKEWCEATKNIDSSVSCDWVENSVNNTTIKTILKLPLAGFRWPTDGAYSGQGTDGRYWTASVFSTSGTQGYGFELTTTQSSTDTKSRKAYGYSLRCLKN